MTSGRIRRRRKTVNDGGPEIAYTNSVDISRIPLDETATTDRWCTLGDFFFTQRKVLSDLSSPKKLCFCLRRDNSKLSTSYDEFLDE